LNPKVVGATLPIENGKVWLLRRGIEPRFGFWTYPAGYQEVDETTEGAAIRETREEIGCDVELDALLGVYSRPHGPVVTIVYLAHFATADAVPHSSTEAIEVGAFSPEEIPWADLAFPSTVQALHDWQLRASSSNRRSR
jgi:ADP-ribose pyrophosphatase YjhB (NUDIX family)